MHSSLVFLTLFSIILITSMVTCFFCFIRSRRKEDEELMEQVQYQHQQHQQQGGGQFGGGLDPQQQHQHQQQARSHKQFSPMPSNNMLINDTTTRQQQHHQFKQTTGGAAGGGGGGGVDYQGRSYQQVQPASPYHSASSLGMNQHGGVVGQQPGPPTEVRSDITQQINSAIIGSSEAEFQNDFIQVFPMYQIAPQPEKNTTPYLT